MERKFTCLKSLLFNIILFGFLTISATVSYASTLKGVVTDASTKEQIIGAVVRINELNISVSTNLEGAYIFKNIAGGNYMVECKFLSLKTLTQKVTVPDGEGVTRLDFAMESENTLKEVNVTGKFNTESDLSARSSEQNSDYVMNILSSQSIELLPDITIANTLQRISGVNVQRNSTGDGRYAVIRGMEKRYSYTTINGIKIPTPDNKNRYVPLDLFPNDIVEKVEVVKALLPSMEADAIGGVINMQLRTAPDYLLVRASASAGYSEIFAGNPFETYNAAAVNPRSPAQIHGNGYLSPLSDFPNSTLDYKTISNPINSTGNIILGKRFLRDKKLGVLFVGSYQNLYKGSVEAYFRPQNKPAQNQEPGTPNIYQNYRGDAPQFDYMFFNKYYTQQTRYAAHANIDYKFNDLNSINFYTVYVYSAQQQVRFQNDSELDKGRVGIGNGNTDNNYRSILTLQSIYNATLQGKHILFDGFKVDWSGVYSIATNNQPDYAEFSTAARAITDSNWHKTTTPWTVAGQSRKWISNTDKDAQGFLNLTYNRNLFGNDFEVKAGGMIRHKTRNNYEIDYSLDPVGTGSSPEYFTTFDQAQFQWLPAGHATGNVVNTNNYTLYEDISAGYLQLKYVFFDKLQVLGGFRVEATSEGYTELTEDPNIFVGITGSKSYYDILPGIHLKYMLNDKMNLRFSYYESLTRPNFYEITPYILPGDYFDEAGNPKVKHTTADNYDLRYEWFPKGIDEILVGAFYKNIYNPIEYAVVANGTSSSAIEPFNFGTATNYGLEVEAIKYFGNFGVSANYTFTNSQITTPKELYYTKPPGAKIPGDTEIQVNQTRPLQGQAAHIGNLSLIYKNAKIGLSSQVAFVYTGRNLAYVNTYYGMDYWQRANWQLDFSGEKSITKRLSVFVKLTNLLNTPTVLEIEQVNTFNVDWERAHLAGLSPTNQKLLLETQMPNQDRQNAITVQVSYYNPTYLLGVRYKL